MGDDHVVDLFEPGGLERGQDAPRVPAVESGPAVSMSTEEPEGETISVACPPSTSMK